MKEIKAPYRTICFGCEQHVDVDVVIKVLGTDPYCTDCYDKAYMELDAIHDINKCKYCEQFYETSGNPETEYDPDLCGICEDEVKREMRDAYGLENTYEGDEE